MQLIPEPGAQCFVNGKPVTSSEVLHTGSRVILGKYHVFRYNDPQEARQSRPNLTSIPSGKNTKHFEGCFEAESAKALGEASERSGGKKF